MTEDDRVRFMIKNADLQELDEWIRIQSADLPSPETGLAEEDSSKRWSLALACMTQMKNIGLALGSTSSYANLQVLYQQLDRVDDIVCASLRLRDSQLFRSIVLSNPEMLSLNTWREVGRTMDLDQVVACYES